jgi:hypothetical protein
MVNHPNRSKVAALRASNALLLAALKEAEYRMSKCPDFNPWDLGPLEPLERVRAAIAKAEGGRS